MIMTDEKGANFDAIGKVFGSNFVKAKIRTCQFHFTNCGMRYIGHLSPQQRFYFRRLCDKLCEAHTRQHYRKVSAKLKKFATDHKFLGWWKFWAPRSPHIVPVFSPNTRIMASKLAPFSSIINRKGFHV